MDGFVDVKLLITLGGVAASVIGTAAVARTQIQRLTEQIKDVEGQLRSADGRTDKLENNSDTQEQRVDILAGMLSPTKRETDSRRSERLLTEVRLFEEFRKERESWNKERQAWMTKRIDHLEKIHNSKHPNTE
jgi:biopolymer transport protein ExbB/TolQ